MCVNHFKEEDTVSVLVLAGCCQGDSLQRKVEAIIRSKAALYRQLQTLK